MNGETALELYEDQLRKYFLKYTRKAFRMLPSLDKPRILDIGCGSGIPTMELAKLSNGQITGLDINQPHLNRLRRKIRKAGLSDRVKTLTCSMFDMEFPDESFDIIWAEGSIAPIGFKRALKEWRRLLRPKGFLAVHDEIGNVTEKLEQVLGCGYVLIGHFIVPEDDWWNEFYAPLQKRIDEFRTKYADDPKTLAALDRDQHFINTFKKNPEQYASVFFVMQKR